MSRAGSLPVTRQTAAEVAGLGVTRRQLDYWVEMGWIRSADPPSAGHPRSFTAAEKRVLSLMVRLRATGLPARVAGPLARAALEKAEESGGGPDGTGLRRVAIGLAPGMVLTVTGI